MYQKLFSANEHTYYVNYAYFYMYNMYTVYIISPPNVVESKYNMDIQQLTVCAVCCITTFIWLYSPAV